MTCQDEVIRIGKKLEKMIATKSSDDVVGLDLLKTLKGLPMTLDVLQKTRIGMTVNGYRKLSKNDEAISLAKALIKIWKKLLQDSNGTSAPSSTAKGQVPSTTSRSISGRVGDDTDSRDSSSQSDILMRGSSPSSDSPRLSDVSKVGGASGERGSVAGYRLKATFTADGARLKCRQMLALALRCEDELVKCGDPDLIAAAIEEIIFQEFKNTDVKYRNRIRSRIANLKDQKNPRLRQRVLTGEISPELMAVMTSEEMAREELKLLRRKMTKDAIDEHSLAKQDSTPSDEFQCEKCELRDTVYNQVETSSEDETTTTFILCNNCGHRWKTI